MFILFVILFGFSEVSMIEVEGEPRQFNLFEIFMLTHKPIKYQ